MSEIPFNKPFVIGKELFYIAQAVMQGHLAGGGEFTRRCESWMQDRYGTPRALLTHSCTAALEMAAILSGVGPDDEVVLPSFTFVSTANAFALRGARLRFVDIREDTLNLDARLVADALGERSRVVVPVHYAGVACEMDALLALAEQHGLLVVEDAAQGVGATYRGAPLGTIGHLGCFSFHETKNFISGEGGALLVNDERFVERAETIRDKGTNRSRFFRGEVDKYTWVELGSSFLPSELVAAFLYAQLEEAETITRRRAGHVAYYRERLESLEKAGRLRLPIVPKDCRDNGHMFYVLLADETERDALIHFLQARGIQSVFHYVPLHLSPVGASMGYVPGDLPVTEGLAARLVRLPCYYGLTREDQDRVVEAVVAFTERSAS